MYGSVPDAIQHALDLVNIPCPIGRYSTKLLKNPDEVFKVLAQLAASIEALSKK